MPFEQGECPLLPPPDAPAVRVVQRLILPRAAPPRLAPEPGAVHPPQPLLERVGDAIADGLAQLVVVAQEAPRKALELGTSQRIARELLRQFLDVVGDEEAVVELRPRPLPRRRAQAPALGQFTLRWGPHEVQHA